MFGLVSMHREGSPSIIALLGSTTIGHCCRQYYLRYERMPNSPMVVSESMLNRPDGGGIFGLRCLKNLCNMDPMLLNQPLLNYPLYLMKRFGLAFPETVGLMSAIEVLPNTAYVFCAAAEALLLMRISDLSPCHRRFAFGYLVAKLLLHLQGMHGYMV